jgi:hypothetical protein
VPQVQRIATTTAVGGLRAGAAVVGVGVVVCVATTLPSARTPARGFAGQDTFNRESNRRWTVASCPAGWRTGDHHFDVIGADHLLDARCIEIG